MEQGHRGSINGNKKRHRRESRHRFGCSLWSSFFLISISISVIMFRMLWKMSGDKVHEGSGAESMLINFAGTVKSHTRNNVEDSVMPKVQNGSKISIDVKGGYLINKKKGDGPRLSFDQVIDRSHRIEIPDNNRSLAFVHIGKSGGSTISLLLRNGCMSAADDIPCEERRWEKYPGPVGKSETVASRRIQFYLHTPHAESGNMLEYYNRVTSVVIVARDPLDRFVSAFLSRHPKNIDATRLRNSKARLLAQAKGLPIPIWAKPVWGHDDVEVNEIHRAAFIGCYPNLEEFAMCAGQQRFVNEIYNTTIHWVKKGHHQRDISLNCKELCRDIAAGKSKYIHHIRWNYQSFCKYY